MRTFLLSVVFHLLLCGDKETNDFALQRYIERDDSVADDLTYITWVSKPGQ